MSGRPAVARVTLGRKRQFSAAPDVGVCCHSREGFPADLHPKDEGKGVATLCRLGNRQREVLMGRVAQALIVSVVTMGIGEIRGEAPDGSTMSEVSSSMTEQRSITESTSRRRLPSSPRLGTGASLAGDSLTGADFEREGRRLKPEAKYDDDVKLVARMLDGDQEAFDAFGARCFTAVYRYTLARMRGDRELSQEIVQVALTKALSRLETYRGESSLTTWLCACCNNEILMHFRRQRTAPAEVELNEELQTTGAFIWYDSSDAEAGLLAREGVELVHMALDQLPESYARVLEWMYIERIPVKEIAVKLGLQEKAAESLLTRARAAFRKSYSSLTG